MNDLDIRKVVQEELNNIAPEVDLASHRPCRGSCAKLSTSIRWIS